MTTTDTFLAQILITDEDTGTSTWLDYARGDEYAATQWARQNPKRRRVVDWIDKSKVLWPPPPPTALELLIAQLAEYELTSAEGVQYAPRILIEQDQAGDVVRLEVGLAVTLPKVDAEGNHVTHTTKLVPSTATDEGEGTGNVFWYEDDEALSHIAWGGEGE